MTVAQRIGQGAGARPLRTLIANRAAVGSVVLLATFVLIAALAPALAPHDPADADLLRRLQPPAWLGGDWAFPLGCDGLGRDILSRLIWGSRVSILIGALVIGVATAGGILAGLAAGYFGGLLDAVISRLADILLAFPYLILAIGLMAMMGPGLHNIVLALVYKEWVVPCRIVRGETLSARESEYVEAARALGASDLRVMWGEILPNVLAPVVVVATVRLAHVIILEASLSFLGLGVQPPTASWGAMVADGREYMLDQWWVSAFPGLAILTLVLAINVASQSLRDLLDTGPRS